MFRGTEYVIAEVVWWMVASAIVGFFIGWFLRRWLRVRRIIARYETALAEAKGMRSEHDAARTGADGDPFSETAEGSVGPVDIAAVVAEIAARTRGVDPDRNDDLTKVRGIGPATAALLESMGITSYRQLSRLTSADSVHLAMALEARTNRIEEHGWIASARELEGSGGE